MNENEKEFLAELSKLSNKYGIAVGGCGCCSSLYLMEIKFAGHYTMGSEMISFDAIKEDGLAGDASADC